MNTFSKNHNEGYDVPLDNIENELDTFWQEAAKEAHTALLKSSTTTLIIFVTRKSRFTKIRNMINDITIHHPSRIIMIFIDFHSAARQISATTSSFCHIPQSDNQQICHELIILNTGKNGMIHLTAALLILLLPDLPVFIWLDNSALLEDADLEFFYTRSNRLIINFRDTAIESIKKQIEYIMQFKDTVISDISWRYLALWREAVARFFDESSAAPELLANIREVKIEYSGRERFWSPLLMIGWIATQLKWHLVQQSQQHYVFSSQTGAQITMILRHSGSIHKNHEINAIHITTLLMDDLTSLHATVKKNGDISWKIKKSGRVFSTQNISSPPFDDARCLCEELDSLSRDEIFIESIAMVLKLLTPVN